MTTIRLSSTPASQTPAQAVVIGVGTASEGITLVPGSEPVDAALGGNLAATLTTLGATGKLGEIIKIPGAGATTAPVIVAVGAGDLSTDVAAAAEGLRRAAGSAVRALAGSTSAVLALPSARTDELAAVAEGALLGGYAYGRYLTSQNGQKPPVGEIVIATALAEDAAAQAAIRRAEVLAEAIHLTRDLINTPPSDLPPAAFAELAAEAAQRHGLAVEVLDEQALVAGGYGGIMGVGQGSVRPPRLVRLGYTHPDATKTIAFVGKGITFDSGGLSIKPAEHMDWMKSDMSGAAAVVAATVAVARLGLAVNVVGYAPLAENMPSGTAQRPSDVLTTYGGKTVEVLNTDAEGRLVLADAMARAGEDNPDLIIDVATLTGAQVVALGARIAGIMANDDALREHVHDASKRAGDSMWPMPLPDDLRKTLDSEIADIANIGERFGGMLIAGLFLREFVPDGVRWAHLDIAGPAFNTSEAYGYTPKGGTGVPVRTLVTLAEDVAAGRLT